MHVDAAGSTVENEVQTGVKTFVFLPLKTKESLSLFALRASRKPVGLVNSF